ncbi:MAG: hypothetical protein WBQ50_03955 [Nocardioides sp.]
MMKFLGRAAAVAVPLLLSVVMLGAPAHAGAGDAAEAQSCGAASYCVQVTYSGNAAPSGGGGGGYVASVPPTCYWSAWKDPAAALAYMKDAWDDPLYSGKEWVLGYGKVEEFEKALENNPDATWYQLECPGLDDGDWQGMVDYSGQAAAGNGYAIPNMALLVPPGTNPPDPDVDIEVLRDAAYDSIDIPEPQTQRNPEVAGSGATLVNLDTMFWADGYSDTWSIRASLSPTLWAEVTASADDFVLTSPAGGQICTHAQYTTAYTGGDAPAGACAFPFTRASVGYGGGFPVTTTASWGASWTSSETAGAQPLPGLTTDSVIDVPVDESQAVVRSVD